MLKSVLEYQKHSWIAVLIINYCLSVIITIDVVFWNGNVHECQANDKAVKKAKIIAPMPGLEREIILLSFN